MCVCIWLYVLVYAPIHWILVFAGKGRELCKSDHNAKVSLIGPFLSFFFFLNK